MVTWLLTLMAACSAAGAYLWLAGALLDRARVRRAWVGPAGNPPGTALLILGLCAMATVSAIIALGVRAAGCR